MEHHTESTWTSDVTPPLPETGESESVYQNEIVSTRDSVWTR